MINEITDATFEQLVNETSKPLLLFFSTSWCMPCKMVRPLIERLSSEYEDKLLVFNSDNDKNTAMKKRFKVRGTPTVVVWNNGEVVASMIGKNINRDNLTAQIEPLLAPQSEN